MNGLYGKLSRRYFFGRRGRSFMTLLGIGLGVTMVVAVLLINAAIVASYENLLAAAAGRADLQISAATGFGFKESFLGEATRVEGVAAAAPVISAASPVTAGARQGSASIYGIDPARDVLVRDYKLTSGRLPEGGGELAVSTELARNMGLAVGGRLDLLTTRGMKGFTVSGIFDAGGTVRGALGPFGVMTLASAQEAFGKEGKLDLIDVVLARGANQDTVKARLTQRLDGSVRIGTPVERSRDMQKMLDSVIFVLTLAGSISLFAGAFIIYTNVSMGVAERRRDLSILRALGMKQGEVMRMVLLEAGLFGVAGAALGLLWGYGLASAAAGQMTDSFLKAYGLQTAHVSLTLMTVIAALAVGVGAAVAAAFAPARETVTVSPVEAMRPTDVAGIDRRRYGWGRLLGGMGMIGGGALVIWLTWPHQAMISPLMLRIWGGLLVLMLLGTVVLLPALLPTLSRWLLAPVLRGVLGVTGRLATDNLVRQPRRTSATICALMVSLAYMVCMGGTKVSQTSTFDRWFAKNIGWDMNVASSYSAVGSLVEMDPSVVEALSGVEGVRLVSPQKLGRAILADGEPGYLQAFDHRLLKQYSETILEQGDWPTALAQMEQGGHAIISPAVSRRLKVGLGDTMAMPTPSGLVKLKVAGIMQDVTPYGGTVQLDRQDYVKYWRDETSSNVAVLVNEGARPEDVRARILARFEGKMPLTVRLNREFWAELRSTFDGFYQLMDGLIWISILVSGLAIANTLFASILERKREFGILRAVGARRGEVVRIVVGEAFATGVIGGIAGVVAGLALQWVMIASSEFINGSAVHWAIGWGALATAAGVALVVAPAVGFLPARWAARLDVVEALRYE